MVNTRNVVGHYDMAVVLKAQVDNLTGRNEELRRELHEVRFEAATAHENLNKANCKAWLITHASDSSVSIAVICICV